VVIGGLALVAIGGWLFVSGRQPGAAVESGVADAPGDPACPDGVETWRAEGPAATFLVPIPGEKVQAACHPAPAAFQAYVDGWQGFDAGGTRTDGRAPGIPPTAFAETDLWTWAGLFSSIEGDAGHHEVDFTLPLQEVALRCQRRYTCLGGQWVPQAATRAVESDPGPTPTSFSISADGAGANAAVDLAMRAVTAWKAAQQADLDRTAFAARCG
jgi:hypothetical protein